MAHPHSETVNTIFHWRVLGNRRGFGSASISEFLPFLTLKTIKTPGQLSSKSPLVDYFRIRGCVNVMFDVMLTLNSSWIAQTSRLRFQSLLRWVP